MVAQNLDKFKYKGKKLPSISIFFPAHNEKDNIPVLLMNAMKVFPRIAEKFEIIVVDDGSVDSTWEILQEYSTKIPELVTIRHEKNQGYGAAIRSGLSASKYEYLFFSDSDNQFDLSEITLFLPHIADSDAVIGFRGKRRDPLIRILNAAGWKLVIRLYLGVKVRDINCAFKLFRKSHIDDIELLSDGAMISAELLAYLFLKKLRIKEIEVSHYPRKKGEQSGADLKVIAKAFRELSVIRKTLSKYSQKKNDTK